jgi:methylated-DNA-[protein]-cysteine S-methyltransferase
MSAYHVFDTAIGWAGIAWGPGGLTGAHLPERAPRIVRVSIAQRHPEATPEPVPPEYVGVVESIRALMRGEKADLSTAPLDIARVPEFHARVYAITRAIPPGETLTYGDVAIQLGDKLLAQQVGAALGKNPWPIIVPCHRVTAAGGKLGGFSAPGRTEAKQRMLALEGVFVGNQPRLL